MLGFTTLILTVSTIISSTSAASYSPTLDINNSTQVTAAAAKALQNLIGYYVPGEEGAFNQIQTPWAVSGQIWGTYMDYLKYTADGQFSNTVTEALVNMSFGTQQDLLDGAQAGLQETILGKWNDDILWPSQAFIAGAEIYGNTTIIKAANGTYVVVAQRTFDEAWQQWDMQCGGGIFWSRDRQSPSANYKSAITNVEFVQQGARNYIQTLNETSLAMTKRTLDWMFSGGLCIISSGAMWDGFETTGCGIFEVSQWSYNYGQLIGSLAWMYQATGNQTYLTLATPFLNTALRVFTNNTLGVIMENCEPNQSCNRDQMGFKAIFVRNLAYLWRATNDQNVKNVIQNVIDKSVAAMVANSCDVNWNCGGNWTTDTEPIKYVQSQAVSSALLIAAVGIHTNYTGSGLLTNINVTALKVTPSGTGTGTSLPNVTSGNPYVESRPLAGAPRLSLDKLGVVSLLVGGLVLLL